MKICLIAEACGYAGGIYIAPIQSRDIPIQTCKVGAILFKHAAVEIWLYKVLLFIHSKWWYLIQIYYDWNMPLWGSSIKVNIDHQYSTGVDTR